MRKLFWLSFLISHLNNKRGIFKRGIAVDIIPTTRCNLHCDYCPMFLYGEVKKYEECSFDEWKVFINRMQHWVSTYYISGGEPSLYKDIVPLTNYLIERGHKVIIMTNLWKPENLYEIKPHWRLMFMPTFHKGQDKIERYSKALKKMQNKFNVTSQQIFQNDYGFDRTKEFFTPEWFKNEDDNLQFAPDSPRTLAIYTGCVNIFKRD